MKLLNDYFMLRDKVHKHFGYKEDWRNIPLADYTDFYWTLHQNEDGSGWVGFADNEKDVSAVDGESYYQFIIYTQHFLPKWVYRANDSTMICVDTRTDDNKYLAVFDNRMEIKGKA